MIEFVLGILALLVVLCIGLIIYAEILSNKIDDLYYHINRLDKRIDKTNKYIR